MTIHLQKGTRFIKIPVDLKVIGLQRSKGSNNIPKLERYNKETITKCTAAKSKLTLAKGEDQKVNQIFPQITISEDILFEIPAMKICNKIQYSVSRHDYKRSLRVTIAQ